VSDNGNSECYYYYFDSICIIEIEVIAGLIEDEGVEEISIRFAVTNPVDIDDSQISRSKKTYQD